MQRVWAAQFENLDVRVENAMHEKARKNQR
jgi:hypothetical protein